MSDGSADRVLAVAKALWDWDHEGRKNEVLEIEWSLLQEDYVERAKAAIDAMEGI